MNLAWIPSSVLRTQWKFIVPTTTSIIWFAFNEIQQNEFGTRIFLDTGNGRSRRLFGWTP
eukprot:2835031-Pyramimonas_sp.AAC.1